MPLFMVRWGDCSMSLVSASSDTNLVQQLDELACPQDCIWKRYSGPVWVDFELKKKPKCQKLSSKRQSPPNDLSKMYTSVLEDALFSDITFIVQGTRLPAHRAILASRNDVFRQMFTGSLAETRTEFEVDDVSCAAFKSFLHYLYTGAPVESYNHEMQVELLQLADKYCDTDLKDIACSRLSDGVWSMSIPDLVALCEISATFNAHHLKKQCLRAILNSSRRDISELSSFVDAAEGNGERLYSLAPNMTSRIRAAFRCDLTTAPLLSAVVRGDITTVRRYVSSDGHELCGIVALQHFIGGAFMRYVLDRSDIYGGGSHLNLLVLLALGADVNGCDENGVTPLMVASSKSDCVILTRLLLSAGADPTMVSTTGETALTVAHASTVSSRGFRLTMGMQQDTVTTETVLTQALSQQQQQQAVSSADEVLADLRSAETVLQSVQRPSSQEWRVPAAIDDLFLAVARGLRVIRCTLGSSVPIVPPLPPPTTATASSTAAQPASINFITLVHWVRTALQQVATTTTTATTGAAAAAVSTPAAAAATAAAVSTPVSGESKATPADVDVSAGAIAIDSDSDGEQQWLPDDELGCRDDWFTLRYPCHEDESAGLTGGTTAGSALCDALLEFAFPNVTRVFDTAPSSYDFDPDTDDLTPLREAVKTDIDKHERTDGEREDVMSLTKLASSTTADDGDDDFSDISDLEDDY